ncbi:MAG: anthranilate synthase component I [Elusimicrobiota bacterium]|jgi:anthranilate synthase component 1|nr:anthranilate synthase component I [Elusimicrobiota bacterium]
MIKPTKEEAKKFLKDYTVVPVYKEIFADIKTSVEILRVFLDQNKQCCLLESVENAENWERYSFLGFDPKLTISCQNGELSISDGKSVKKQTTDQPFEVLREILSQYKSPQISSIPPFSGGFVGYFSYECVQYFETSLKLKAQNPEGFDDFRLMLFDKVIAVDCLKQKIFIIANASLKDLDKSYAEAEQAVLDIEKLIKGSFSHRAPKSKLSSPFTPLHTEKTFLKMVKKAKDHIFEGDIFQVVISNRLTANFEGSLLQTYRILRQSNPSPYMFYLNFGDMEAAGASPETLVTLRNRQLINYALAGTCKRGADFKEDEKLIKALLSDEKERAEHNMLVDLARNDLGKISEFGTVKVQEYMKIVKFSHVSHIASSIVGKMRKNFDQIDALGAVLPAGTLSGAPKKRACQIIDDLEQNKRGVYGGAAGYIDFSGNMDACIAIRMAVLKNGKVYVQAGAGIVADSQPKKEFNECLHKAAAMKNAVEAACREEK